MPLVDFPATGMRIIERHLITQPNALGLAGKSGTIGTNYIGARNISVIALDPEETCLIPLSSVCPSTDIDQIVVNFNMPASKDYMFSWRFYVFDHNMAIWEDPGGGSVSGVISGTDTGIGLNSVTITLPDQSPSAPGRGIGGFASNRLIGLAISNFPYGTSNHIKIYHASVFKWVASLPTALGAG